jgi:hypothetical protein
MPNFIDNTRLALKHSNTLDMTLIINNRCKEEVEETKIFKVIQS